MGQIENNIFLKMKTVNRIRVKPNHMNTHTKCEWSKDPN